MATPTIENIINAILFTPVGVAERPNLSFYTITKESMASGDAQRIIEHGLAEALEYIQEKETTNNKPEFYYTSQNDTGGYTGWVDTKPSDDIVKNSLEDCKSWFDRIVTTWFNANKCTPIRTKEQLKPDYYLKKNANTPSL